MTSKNSFWASSRENHKRRIWVWIVAVLSQLLVYGGMMMIYLSRIKGTYAEGGFKTLEGFHEGMCRAARDALGFSDNLYGIIFILAAIIGMQGFSYLYDRKKVDMYHSVPVSKNRRFAVVYINGIFIYLVANLSGMILGTVIALSQRAVNADVLANAGLAFVWNLFLFLAFYHMMILAVMLTGNRFVTICVFLTFVLYEYYLQNQIGRLSRIFFDTYSEYYISTEPKLSVIYDCTLNIWSIKNARDAAAAAAIAMPIVGKWILIAAVLLGLSYFAYRKRPSEAAGRAMAFPVMEPVLKVAVAIPVAFMAGGLVYDTSYQNEMLQVAGMMAGGMIFCTAAEVLFDFDIRSLFKHLPSSGIALAGILAIFSVFKWDVFGYDSYIPAQNKVESIAISADGYYDSYWDENRQYMDKSQFEKENMFLTDTEPVLALAKAAEGADPENMGDGRSVQILYRLKSGRQAARSIRVDYDDPDTEALFNRIFCTDAFKKGVFQGITEETSYADVTRVTYSNGAAKTVIPVEEAGQLKEAWIKDMEQFDFTLVRHNRPCGILSFEYMNYNQRQWFVYESFANTIAALEKLEAYYPMELDAADIESVTVTCYHNELTELENAVDYGIEPRAVAYPATWDVGYTDYTVSETFYEEQQIAQILPHIYNNWVDAPWGRYKDLDDNYSVQVVFKRDSAYPYERDSYYFTYSFYAEQVPEFVAEATAYSGESE
ncbi:MAG: hypothetical protein K2H37_12255 [Lachnospiraceae bacterium]|nr:hypothetical protein [Lachnospiraceae bacterium]